MQVYRLHSQTSVYRRKVEKSISVIKEFLEIEGSKYCSISGGKDSTCMAHMVWSVEPSMKFMSEKDDMDFPGEIEYLNELSIRYKWDIDIITPGVSLWDIINEYNITDDIHSHGTAFSDKYFYDLLKKYQKDNNMKGVFLGLRAQESKGRLWNFKKRGMIYYNKEWGQWICQPLALWSAKDVFAYLVSNDIPIFSVYFNTNFVTSPEDIRKSWILPSSQTSQGQAVWLKYYYPEIFNKLCIIKPELRTYV